MASKLNTRCFDVFAACVTAIKAGVHKNKSFRGFGSYGDILVRDRKMYVAPTPFALLTGVTALPTLVIPSGYKMDPRFQKVGNLTRVEADTIVVGYEFDLKRNELKPKHKLPEPSGDAAD